MPTDPNPTLPGRARPAAHADRVAHHRFTRDYYERHLAQYGTTDIRAMGWHEQHSYWLRFDLVAHIGDLDGRTVLDVGCGFGGLHDYLAGKQVRVARYLGVDLLEDMVDCARARNPGAEFSALDILDEDPGHFDYVFCIGTLNVGGAGYGTFVRDMLTRMVSLARTGVAYSFLDRGNLLARQPPYHTERPAELRRWVEEALGCQVEVVRDLALPGEACLYIWPPDRG